MRKPTTIDLDLDLLREAAAALGTTRTTDTIHAALSEVVRHRQRMAILDFGPAIDLADLDAMRGHRFAQLRTPHGSEPD